MRFYRFSICLICSILIGIFTFGININNLFAKTTLKFAFPMSTKHHTYPSILAFSDYIDEKTDGEVKVTIFPAQSLCKSAEGLDAVRKGIADISLAMPNWFPGRIDVTTVMNLPGAYPNSIIGTHIGNALSEKYFKKDYEKNGVMLLTDFTTGPYQIMTTKKPVKQISDLNGLKLRSSGGYFTHAIKALGAIVITIPTMDIYDGLSKGIMDGLVFAFSSAPGYKLEEVIKYVTMVDMAAIYSSIIMNPSSFNDLSKHHQSVVLNAARLLSKSHAETYYEFDQKGKQIMVDHGVEVISLSKNERSLINRRLRQLWDMWVTEMDSKGYPANDIIRDFNKEREKYCLED
jgi:TRAP-type C4-dicarboxylate transport system substrate-binding protein